MLNFSDDRVCVNFARYILPQRLQRIREITVNSRIDPILDIYADRVSASIGIMPHLRQFTVIFQGIFDNGYYTLANGTIESTLGDLSSHRREGLRMYFFVDVDPLVYGEWIHQDAQNRLRLYGRWPVRELNPIPED